MRGEKTHARRERLGDEDQQHKALEVRRAKRQRQRPSEREEQRPGREGRTSSATAAWCSTSHGWPLSSCTASASRSAWPAKNARRASVGGCVFGGAVAAAWDHERRAARKEKKASSSGVVWEGDRRQRGALQTEPW